MSRRKFVIIKENISRYIMEARKAKWGPEQIAVYINTPDTTWDVLSMIELVIGIKITRDNKQWGEAVSFGFSDVNDENIEKALNYLVNYSTTNESPLTKGVPIAGRSVGQIKAKMEEGQMTEEFKKKLQEYCDGNEAALGYLIGYLMKVAKGKLHPKDIQDTLSQMSANYKTEKSFSVEGFLNEHIKPLVEG